MKKLIATLISVSVLFLTACGSSSTNESALPMQNDGPKKVYVAIGASESVGFGADSPLREGWTKVFWQTALTRATTYNDLAVAGSAAGDAVSQQVDFAKNLQPDYVTVWLNVNDIIDDVDSTTFEQNIRQILSALHTGTHAQILIANTPPLDQMPSYLSARSGNFPRGSPWDRGSVPTPSTLNATVDTYNAVIAAAAKDNAATVVDLHQLGLDARTNGTAASFFATDGFHPSTQGHAAIAKAFASALKPT